MHCFIISASIYQSEPKSVQVKSNTNKSSVIKGSLLSTLVQVSQNIQKSDSKPYT